MSNHTISVHLNYWLSQTNFLSRNDENQQYLFYFYLSGTFLTLLTALGTTGVRRFIYCSSMSVSIGNNDVTEGIVESDPIPSQRTFEPYASSKLAGERIVLAANGNLLYKSTNTAYFSI